MDHPRSAGSSPHTRGARNFGSAACRSRGIIPAYAGSTAIFDQSLSVYEDHPRIRGEHAAHGFASRGRRGSSPHTRGAQPHSAAPRTRIRIIPAYAGSTRLSGLYTGDGQGSSPHTRGARMPGDPRRLRFRIIPAYAGSTLASSSLHIFMQDHPRIRGEHLTR